MKLLEIRYSDGERDKAMTETRNMVNKYPELKGITVGDGNVYLGEPFIFDKANIDQFPF